jgi:poly(3-hydroxybutyrate) depolymerase
MPDNAVAYHAGKTDKNPKFGNWNTIGIAAAANDNDDVTPEQQASAARLAKELSQKYGFDIQNVFGHGQVSSQKMATEGGALVSAVKGGATQVAPAPASGVSIASASTAVEDGQRRQTLGSTTGSNTVVSSNTTNVKKSDTIRRDEFHDTTLIRNVYGV